MSHQHSLEEDLKPVHYKKGQDTWAYAERTYCKQSLLDIADFNIHKYSTREKGQNELDKQKVKHYGLWQERIKAEF